METSTESSGAAPSPALACTDASMSGLLCNRDLLMLELGSPALGDLLLRAVEPALDTTLRVESLLDRVLRGAHPHRVRAAGVEAAAWRWVEKTWRCAGNRMQL